MDGGDVESGDGLREDQRRLREWLRGAAGVGLAGDGSFFFHERRPAGTLLN